ncbi:Zinc finger protein [Plakobranchus ocellatus]|uniref:Zinc finger protein n=1 Tax=Plakobranchus ocellatus TaxID=259542 RepID=A0AAV3YN66_9GAST|nr:Zinc finger protein [Plakobranchus ocellatus]
MTAVGQSLSKITRAIDPVDSFDKMPVFETDTAAPPATVVRFSNGTVHRKVAVKSYIKEQHAEGNSNRQQIVTACVDGMSYVGSNFGASNFFPTDSCNYYVGIHNKSTGKIKVVPASLIQLEPWLKKEKDIVSLNANNKTAKEKSDVLATEFGSGRSQRAVNKRLREKLDEAMVASTAKNALDSSVIEENVAATTELAMQSDAIPPYNADAKTPDEVYMLKDIVSKEVLSCIKEVSSALTCASKQDLALWREEQRYFSFILNKVETLSDVPQARVLQGQCLMYLQYLMELYLMKSHQLRLKFPLPKEWPQKVRDHLLDTFTLEIKEPGKRCYRCVPSRKKDLLLSHILVLCLKMSEFALDITPLMVDLKHAARKLITHASSLGCTSKKSKAGQRDVYTIVLKVPLTFPTLKGKMVKNKIF